MNKIIRCICLLTVLTVFMSCTSFPFVEETPKKTVSKTSSTYTKKADTSTTSAPVPKTRSITISNMTISSDMTKDGFVSWYGVDYVYGGNALFEVGYFSFLSNPEKKYGFVLYDGGTEGVHALYERSGLEQKWYFGDDATFLFVLKPDNTGLYYDFTGVPEGESIKPKDIYKMYKK